ncbi:MAG: GNAT family N-acetyltransferase [Roseobacter sp.]
MRQAETPADFEAASVLCWAYRDFLLAQDEITRDLASVYYPVPVYQALMQALPQKYGAAGAKLMLAFDGPDAFGCGMYHGLTAQDVEIKRVYISPKARGKGAGEALSMALVEAAKSDGYKRILLDTNPRFTAARSLYEKLGFVSRGPYADMPDGVADKLVYYELTL